MGISKGMVVAAAAIAFGLVAVEDMTKGWTAAPSFAVAQVAVTDEMVVQNAALRARAAESLRALTQKQQAADPAVRTSSPSQKCREQSWPYYSEECLVGSNGSGVAPVARVVGFDRPAPATVRLAGLR